MIIWNSESRINIRLFDTHICLLFTIYLLQSTTYQLPTFLTVKGLIDNELSSALCTKLLNNREDEYYSGRYFVDLSIKHSINYTRGHFIPLVYSSNCGTHRHVGTIDSLTSIESSTWKASQTNEPTFDSIKSRSIAGCKKVDDLPVDSSAVYPARQDRQIGSIQRKRGVFLDKQTKNKRSTKSTKYAQ